MKARLSVLVALAMLGLVFAACTARPSPSPTTTSPSTAPATTFIAAPPVSPTPVSPPASGNATQGAYGVYGFGREATDEEFAAWNIDISPDGTGLPAGSGTPAQGATLFASTCAPCHGDKGQGTANSAGIVLIGTAPWYKLGDPKSVGPPTIGNYWPYATTLYDYIRRAMPFTAPESLTNDQLYQVVAWLLNQNKIIGDNDVMNAQTLPKVQMPNRDGFVPDPRPWPEVQ